MSFEGYTQDLCENGHRSDGQLTYGGYGDNKELDICPYCKAKIVFSNLVDDTNLDDSGVILESGWETLKISEAVFETCPTCDNRKLVERARYRVPTDEELKQLRAYLESDGEYYSLETGEKL